MPYIPTPEKLTAYGFAVDKDTVTEWRRYDGKQLFRLSTYATGFELSISSGWAGVCFMRFSPSSEQFFDELMLSVGQ